MSSVTSGNMYFADETTNDDEETLSETDSFDSRRSLFSLFPYESEATGLLAIADTYIQQAYYLGKKRKYNEMKELLSLAAEMGDARGYFYLAKHYQQQACFALMRKFFLLNIRYYNCDKSMLELGLYYNDADKTSKMLHYYHLAAKNNNIAAIYNLSQYYKGMNNIEKMMEFMQHGIDLGDADAMYEMAQYYGSIGIRNDEKMIQYYLMAVETDTSEPLVNNGIKGFNMIYLLRAMELIQKPTEKMKAKYSLLTNEFTDYLIYKNKISLFTKLHYIQDCMICFENKLHIDLNCAHCFCIDCYPSIYNLKCPLCRIVSTSKK